MLGNKDPNPSSHVFCVCLGKPLHCSACCFPHMENCYPGSIYLKGVVEVKYGNVCQGNAPQCGRLMALPQPR